MSELGPLVVISGHDRSGKSTVARMIADRTQWPVVELGDFVRRAQASNLGLSRNTSVAAEQLREAHGPAMVGEWMELAGIPLTGPGLVVGLRSSKSYEELKPRTSSLTVVHVDAPLATRQSRSPRASIAAEDLLATSERHISWGLELICAEAEFRIDNSGHRNQLQAQVEVFLKEFWKSTSALTQFQDPTRSERLR